MEHLEQTDTLNDEEIPFKGFSKKQILQLSPKDIDNLILMEYPDGTPADKKHRLKTIENGVQVHGKDHQNGSPRPLQEEDFPNGEEGENYPLSKVSDPEKKN